MHFKFSVKLKAIRQAQRCKHFYQRYQEWNSITRIVCNKYESNPDDPENNSCASLQNVISLHDSLQFYMLKCPIYFLKEESSRQNAAYHELFYVELTDYLNVGLALEPIEVWLWVYMCPSIWAIIYIYIYVNLSLYWISYLLLRIVWQIVIIPTMAW